MTNGNCTKFDDSCGSVPRIGVATFIMRYPHDPSPQFLLMKRANGRGEGSWGLPGGAIEYGEDPDAAAFREAAEEVGITLQKHQLIGTSSFADQQSHWITLLYSSALPPGEVPKILEPDKCSDLLWASMESMPSPLFGPLEAFFQLDRPFTAVE